MSGHAAPLPPATRSAGHGRLLIVWHRLLEKGLRYWLVGAALLIGLVVAQPVVEERLNLHDARNALFTLLTRSVTNPSVAHQVKLVWIGDRDFWGPEMGHRSPTNRAYLARLVRAADAADASVVALSFDLSLPGGPVRVGDYARIDTPYRAETDDLARAVGEVASHRRVVLPRVVRAEGEGEEAAYTMSPDALAVYGVCARLRPDGTWDNPGTPAFPLSPAAKANISCGYINEMDDNREVPGPVKIAGGRMDALPLALVRAREPDAPDRLGSGRRYASYVSEAALHAPNLSIAAGDLLARPEAARARLQGYPVIIAAAWHLDGPGEGPVVDVHDTPIGQVPGALIPANIAEAVLSSRTYPALSHPAMMAIEVTLGIAAAILFALVPSALLAGLLLAAAMPVLLFVQWLFLQLFGTFLDLFAPILGLGLHAIADRVINGHEA